MPAHALRHDPRAQLHQQAGNIRVLAHEAAVNWRNAEVRAESHAKAMEPGRARWFGRDSSSWTVRQEDWYQARLALLAQAGATDMRAKLVRLDRMVEAYAQQLNRLGANERTDPVEYDDRATLARARNALALLLD